MTASIDVHWYDKNKLIVLWTFPGTFTVEDYVVATDMSFELAEHINHAHCVIYDLTQTHHIPSGALTQLRVAQRRAVASPKYLFTVVVGANAGIIRLTKIFIQTMERVRLKNLVNDRVYFTNTLAEALDLIQMKLQIDDIELLNSGS